MAILVTPTTELEAVNECLANIGQSPVASVSGDLGVDAELAKSLVEATSRELQARGFYWNTEKDYTLTPNSDDEIVLPSNTLSVELMADEKWDKDYIQRGTRLYDRKNHTYTITESVDVVIVLGLNFTDLPETARRYIALRAARIFQNRVEGANDEQDLESEQRAYADLITEDMRIQDNNMIKDNYETYDMLRRFVY